MVSGIGTSGSYDIVVSLTGYWDHTHAGLTIPVVYGPALTSTNTPNDNDNEDGGDGGGGDPPVAQQSQIGPVTDIAVAQLGDTTATIVWPASGDGDGVQYQLGWYRSPGIPRIKYAATTGTVHRITGLQPDTSYKVFVIAYRGARILNTHTITVTTLPNGQTEQSAVTVPPVPPDREPLKQETAVPVISVIAGSDVTEGSPAQFTLTASPPPAADLDVTVTVTQSGDWVATAGRRTVTIGTAGTATLTIGTADDDTDETDGSITATVNTHSGYTVSPTAGAATVAVADDDTTAPVTPVISITAAAGVTEGSNAVFTLTASPAPAADLDVTVTVTQNGDWGATAGRRTVTIGTAGTATLTIGTADDDTDETDGSITATVNTHSGYTVSPTAGAATAAVEDDDTPEVSITTDTGAVTEGSAASFTLTADIAPHTNLDVTLTVTATGDHAAATGTRTVTITAGATSAGFTITTTNDHTDEPDGTITVTLDTPAAGAGYTVTNTTDTATVTVADDDIPQISVTAGAGVTEGSPASFTLTADIAPHTNLDVTLTVTATGDHAAATGTRTVTITAGTTSTGFTVTTAGDHTDEADGTVTVTLDAPAADAGYTVTNTACTATVTVEDDDIPEISITADTAAVTEGNPASFTLTADIAPHTNLDITLTITATGDHGATTGTRTVTIDTSGSVTFTITTTNDNTDEADGTITATLDTPAADAGYTVSATQGTATVTVEDDDDPPTTLTITIEDASTSEGDVLTFRVTLSHAPTTTNPNQLEHRHRLAHPRQQSPHQRLPTNLRHHHLQTRTNHPNSPNLDRTRQPQRTRRTLRHRSLPPRQLATTRRHRHNDHHQQRLTRTDSRHEQGCNTVNAADGPQPLTRLTGTVPATRCAPTKRSKPRPLGCGSAVVMSPCPR